MFEFASGSRAKEGDKTQAYRTIRTRLMVKKVFVIAALALVVGAAFLFIRERSEAGSNSPASAFVRTYASQFVVAGKPFRFVGANVSVMYRDEDRVRMPETLRQASQAGMRVVRVWASGEGGPGDIGPVADHADWPVRCDRHR